MAVAQEITNVDLNNWPPGTKFYGTDDERYFVIIADLVDYPNDGAFSFVRQPTRILYTNENGNPPDLLPDFTFDPGTTYEDAIIGAGFTLA